MFKLLVNTPKGTQEIVSVTATGGYFELERVLWDERADGPLPAITLGGMVRNGDALEFSQARKDEHDAAAVEPVPERVTAYQAKAALHLGGHYASVQAIMANEATDPLAVIAWENAGHFRRQSPFIASIGPALGLSDAQIDQLFRDAAAIE